MRLWVEAASRSGCVVSAVVSGAPHRSSSVSVSVSSASPAEHTPSLKKPARTSCMRSTHNSTHHNTRHGHHRNKAAKKKVLVQHWRKLLSSNELRRSVVLRNVLGPTGRPGASAVNDTVLSGHFDSLSTKGSPMPECWKKQGQQQEQRVCRSHPLSRETSMIKCDYQRRPSATDKGKQAGSLTGVSANH